MQYTITDILLYENSVLKTIELCPVSVKKNCFRLPLA